MKLKFWEHEEQQEEYKVEKIIYHNELGHKNAEESILNLFNVGAITAQQYNERPWFCDVWEVDRYILELRQGTYTHIDPTGSVYMPDNRFIEPISSGTFGYPTAAYYEGNPIITWTDFFSGKYKSTVFNLCRYCGSTKKTYEFNLLGHPVCVFCGAEIS